MTSNYDKIDSNGWYMTIYVNYVKPSTIRFGRLEKLNNIYISTAAVVLFPIQLQHKSHAGPISTAATKSRKKGFDMKSP